MFTLNKVYILCLFALLIWGYYGDYMLLRRLHLADINPFCHIKERWNNLLACFDNRHYAATDISITWNQSYHFRPMGWVLRRLHKFGGQQRIHFHESATSLKAVLSPWFSFLYVVMIVQTDNKVRSQLYTLYFLFYVIVSDS